MFQIIDIHWEYDKQKKKYSQMLTLLDEESGESKGFDLKGYDFNFKLTSKKFCPGYFDSEGYHPCEQNNLLTDSYELCMLCERKHGFKAAFLYGQEPNEIIRQHLSQEHYIYLAYFAGDKIKVGTAASSRERVRLIEQDALIYTFIAKNDGFNIQNLEHKISKTIGITETVNSSYKFRHLIEKPNLEIASLHLKQSFEKIKKVVEGSEFQDWLLKDSEIVDLTSTDGLYFPDHQPDLLKNELTISGAFSGLRGRFLIVKNHEQTYAFDVRDLVGRKIEDYIDEHKYSSKQQENNEQQIGLGV